MSDRLNRFGRHVGRIPQRAADWLRYRVTGLRANLMFFAQLEGHWLNRLLHLLRWLVRSLALGAHAAWRFVRLLAGLTRGMGPADEPDEYE